MARFLTLTFRGTIARGKRGRTIRRRVKMGPVSLCFVTVILLCFVSLFYLAQSNQTATKGYEIRELEDKLDGLQEANKKLELEAAGLQSVKNIEAAAGHLNMIPIEKIFYITPTGTVVALQKN